MEIVKVHLLVFLLDDQGHTITSRDIVTPLCYVTQSFDLLKRWAELQIALAYLQQAVEKTN